MSEQAQYAQSRDLTQDEWFELYQKTKQERDESRADANYAERESSKMQVERNEAIAQMCQAIGYLSTVAEDCEAWINGESEEPSMDFIKAIRDYARKVVNQ